MIANWPELRAFALSLGLPRVEIAESWGNEILKAHGKMWTWWSPYVDAAIFKGSIDEREMLMAADPDTFILHPHYAKFGNILVAAGRIDPGWAEARLCNSWRSMAPKRFLKEWDASQNDG
ncbi:MmcQ/YjbR family DNA-binding protein [uncultured Tateyamaria sp.]|uniref:MmcQ/YjbR family DNA-binding protein n=1 Tax=uncultured Tateyamaria sp. TaxID=455651 RepID=UPI00260CD1D1|nr:MmcQ/YjbR family DNA-binding protein [uncultured Tateyamaria sp.]